MKKIVILCTVGVSIRDNLTRGVMRKINTRDEYAREIMEIIKSAREHQDLADARKALGSIIKLFNNNPDKGNYRAPPLQGTPREMMRDLLATADFDWESFAKRRFPTVEAQTIVGWLAGRKDTREEIELHMFPGKNILSQLTAEAGALCLWMACKLQNRDHSIKIVTCEMDMTSRDGLLKSIDELYRQFDKCRINAQKQGDRIVINVTGSHKPVMAYATVYSQLHDIPAIYLSETSPIVLELVPLPLAYAINQLDEEISLLRGLKNNPGFVNESGIWSSLPRWTKALFLSQGGKKEPTYLVDSLIRRFDEAAPETTAIGAGLLNFLSDKSDRGIVSQYIHDQIKYDWMHIWLGDQIPETVEHSRRHSKRLMEIATNCYRSTRRIDELGLNKCFPLALLISSIYLHDIGHTSICYPAPAQGQRSLFPIGLFPSAVREVHHLLSEIIISESGPRLFPIPKIKSETISEATVNKLRILVPLVCAYHRRYTRLNGIKSVAAPEKISAVAEFLFPEDIRQRSLGPLEKRLQELKPDSGSALDDAIIQDVLRVTALLRIVDACDVQADRAGNRGYLIARLERTRAEAEALYAEMRPLAGCLDILAGESERERGSSILCRISRIVELAKKFSPRAIDNIDEEARDEISRIVDELYPAIFQVLKGMKGDGDFDHLYRGPCADKFFALSLANRVAFKWEQFLHFYRHRAVAFVLPVSHENGAIRVLLHPSDNKPETIQECDKIREVIHREIESCHEVLSELDISAEVYQKS